MMNSFATKKRIDAFEVRDAIFILAHEIYWYSFFAQLWCVEQLDYDLTCQKFRFDTIHASKTNPGVRLTKYRVVVSRVQFFA